MEQVRFSIPAYAAAAIAGSVLFAMFVSLAGGLNVASPGVSLILLFALFYSMPTMLFMMPATFLGIYLANRYSWRSKRHFFVFSAAATLVTAAALLPFERKLSVSFDEVADIALFMGATLAIAVSGGSAGLVYRAVLIRSKPRADNGLTLF